MMKIVNIFQGTDKEGNHYIAVPLFDGTIKIVPVCRELSKREIEEAEIRIEKSFLKNLEVAIIGREALEHE